MPVESKPHRLLVVDAFLGAVGVEDLRSQHKQIVQSCTRSRTFLLFTGKPAPPPPKKDERQERRRRDKTTAWRVERTFWNLMVSFTLNCTSELSCVVRGVWGRWQVRHSAEAPFYILCTYLLYQLVKSFGTKPCTPT